VHRAEILKLIELVGQLQNQVACMELALQPEDSETADAPLPVIAEPKPAKRSGEACPPLAVAAVLASVVAAVVLPAVAAALTSKPTEEPQVVGHYSVSASPASGNGPPTPVETVSTEEGSETDSVEALLLEAEQHSADGFMSLAKHQQATTAKVRAAAARKRAQPTRPKRATP
jgi:hypothetical protein